MKEIQFVDNSGSFYIEHPENTNYLYFPLASETGLKSCVSPNLGGDSKINQETFLLEPVSSENLHNNRAVRNFWIKTDTGEIFSATGASDVQEAEKFSKTQDDCSITAGFMWHTLERIHSATTLKTQITSFVPPEDNVEIMYITLHNLSDKAQTITPYCAIPIYGRSADNIRDHRHVTSLLHRIQTTKNGVTVSPTMSFDERGHRPNQNIYYVYGYSEMQDTPEAFFPTVEDFIGEGGSYTHPRAIYESYDGIPTNTSLYGREAMGAWRFPKKTLKPHEKIQYVILMGVEDSKDKIEEIYQKYNSIETIESSLKYTSHSWCEKVNVQFSTSDSNMDAFMKWVCFQPHLRRIFGCSFLPHHDYGRGGRGWRDLWQDCLSLLLANPKDVGTMIENNFGGVRIDGTNATIIGDGNGNFIADRNSITRVWMDHALWPQITTLLYINQTGDFDILNKKVSYFKDGQTQRGTEIDTLWEPKQGNQQLTTDGAIYTGTILEHLLIQQLVAFYDVGDHTIYRLRGADWNDAIDMASERGESVAFTYAYAGNLRNLAAIIRKLQENLSIEEVPFIEEIKPLLQESPESFSDIHTKKVILQQYLDSCTHSISGRHLYVNLSWLANHLDKKADWLTNFLREHEWITESGDTGWFNSYYDNHGNQVEGIFSNGVRMMLTGQVFAIMGNVASKQQVEQIVCSADKYLYHPERGGYALNTDFQELKFDMGRMFGFAYGEKENGAVFSHMTVMFANALYQRGFAKEGWKALQTLAKTALDFKTSKIYPGIPEYFRLDGRGMYHYLTGAASWFMLTMITQVFGVRGLCGDLILDPKLVAEQFDHSGNASILVSFAGKPLQITYKNPQRKEYGEYTVDSAYYNETNSITFQNGLLTITRDELLSFNNEITHIDVHLI